ncbi:nucleotide sugar dehydrogenase [Mesotoga sp. H07.pep.5.3]|uniref:nucleotide sugar dehydrogenase n=1 Tax=Mesotoga sp. H07.pep.5.3 TaxID=1421003 RepID=UPI000C17863D|nr:nucleotide sugar dehydrogenase [Mesotoga sp. H07.pep.5.3]
MISDNIGKDLPTFERKDIPIVCIQGLGFVGAAMAVAVSSAVDSNGDPKYNVIGLDLPNERGKKIVDGINSGVFPFESTDKKLLDHFKNSVSRKNLFATTNPEAISLASIIIVDINLDLSWKNSSPDVDLNGFIRGIRTIAENVSVNSLVIVETTVPPGTCEKVVVPEIARILEKRGLPNDSILVAHSYERVMPGSDYLDSIINYWRVYSGHTKEAADRCMNFLSDFINTEKFPLTRLSSTTASETAKVLENSYRAVNIAFMEEWGRFAEEIGINMFEIVDAIRKRPTHSNIRQPGFGVGGYCLTKDPLFAKVAAEKLFGKKIDFQFSERAVDINNRMPLAVITRLENFFGNNLSGKKVLLLGVSYRQDVGDTRNTPSEVLLRELNRRCVEVTCHDPLVEYWQEMDTEVRHDMPDLEDFDIAILAVPHSEYRNVDFTKLPSGKNFAILDANNVLTDEQVEQIKAIGNELLFIGRGN